MQQRVESDEPTSDAVEATVDELGVALGSDFGTAAFPVGEGWRLVGVAARTFRQRVPVVSLAHGEQTLCFIVTPTDPGELAYQRTRRFDVTYFSEDVGDDEQDVIYRRDRAVIDAFVAWLRRREVE